MCMYTIIHVSILYMSIQESSIVARMSTFLQLRSSASTGADLNGQPSPREHLEQFGGMNSNWKTYTINSYIAGFPHHTCSDIGPKHALQSLFTKCLITHLDTPSTGNQNPYRRCMYANKHLRSQHKFGAKHLQHMARTHLIIHH